MYCSEGLTVYKPVMIRRERPDRYGSVAGLDNSELAEPDELEKQVFMEQWGPILALPARGRANSIQPVIDESCGIDWCFFATVDFDRYDMGFLRDEKSL
jgi:hypothetical protein